MSINDRIKKEMEARGWTCYELGKRAKLEPSTVSGWFKTVPTKPKYDSIKAVAKAFGIKPEDLVSENRESDPRTRRLLESWNRLDNKEKDSILNIITAILEHNK